MPPQTWFRSLADLAQLPYFSLRGGRLVLADRTLGPAIDVHCHLALSYGAGGRADLGRLSERVEHYLPVERPLDLDLYANQNFPGEDLWRMKLDLTLASFTGSGMRLSHTLPNLLREMDELAISGAVLLPIDFSVLSANAEAWLAAARGKEEIICFGSVHPAARDLAGALDRQVALGIRGLKVHPAVQLVAPEDPRAVELYRLCGARGLPVLFHCGPVGIETRIGRRLSQVRRYERPIASCPETTFVLGHAGALQWEEALELAVRYPNVYLEVSCQSLPALRRILDRADPERILFGSDWPFYHQALPLAKVLMATEGRAELRRRVLHENAAALLSRTARP